MPSNGLLGDVVGCGMYVKTTPIVGQNVEYRSYNLTINNILRDTKDHMDLVGKDKVQVVL